jgi:hypothetical protein
MTSARSHPDIDALRDRLDRTVAAAAAIRILGWLGRLACIAVAASLIVAAGDAVVGPLATIVVWMACGGLTCCGAIAAWRQFAAPRPRRLDIALAAEATAPQIGERISRAVGFLDDQAEDDLGGWKTLALADAAAAATQVARLPVPGLRGHAGWLAAGSVMLACLAATSPWRPRSATVPEAGHEPPSRDADDDRTRAAIDLTELAAAISAQAAVEASLANCLGDRFARAPGIAADDLPAADRLDLARLADVHDDLAREIGRSRDAIASRAATMPAARAAADSLDDVDAALLDRATAAIADHRLATALRITTDTAAALTAAVRHLGHTTSLPEAREAELRSDGAVAARRLAATLAEIADRPAAGAARAAGPNEIGRPAPSATGPPTSAASPATSGGAADAGGVATTEPRFGRGDGRQEPTAPPTARQPTPPWSRLPARVRPVLPRGAEPGIPPAYRRAVDLYYKSLLDALPAAPAIPEPNP